MTWPDAEAVLLKVLRECLENENIGPSDNFFAVGGDSLLALDVIAAVREHGWRVSMRAVATLPTIGEVARSAVAETGAGPAKAADDPFAGLDDRDRRQMPAGVAAAVPASVLQVGLIYLAEVAQGPKPYTDFLGLRVHGVLDERAMRAALAATMARHRVLRSSFDLDSFAEAQQLIWADVDLPLTVQQADDDESAEKAVHVWRDGLRGDGIAWDQPPLFRCQVVVSPSSFRLSVAVHHAIVDGWSFARLIVELLTCYKAECDGRLVALPPVPDHAHRDFVALERADVASAEAARFWLGLATDPPLLFGERRPARADPTARRLVPVPQSMWARLRQAADEYRVPAKSLLLAAHGWALGQLAGRASVVSGVVVNGRPEIEGADRLVGLFLNTLPVRLPKVTGSWPEMAAAARDAEGDALVYRRYPLAHIEHALGRPPFDVSFNFTNFRVFDELARVRDLRVDNWWTHDKTTFPLQVAVLADARESGTRLVVTFDPALIEAEKVQRYIALMNEAFSSATSAGGSR